MDARHEKRFACIDVADADDYRCIHNELFDTYSPAARSLPQIDCIEFVVQGFRPQRHEQLVLEWRRAPMQGPEATRIPKSQGLARVKINVDVIVHARGRAVIDNKNAAGHAEMQYRRSATGIDQQVLGAPSD